MKRTPSRRVFRPLPWLIALTLAAAVVLGLASASPTTLAQSNTPTSEPTRDGTYTVQPGDSWTSIARRTGVSIRELQAANPQAVRPDRWLRSGEVLVLPAAPSAGATPAPTAESEAAAQEEAEATDTPTGDVYHVVKPGESWNSIAALYGVPARLLRAANPEAVRADLVLYRGQRLLIPPVPEEGATPAVTPSPVEEPIVEEEVTPQEFAEQEATEEPAPTETPTEVPTEEPTATPTATPQTAIGIDCPARISDYPAQVNAILNNPEWGIEGVRSYFADCGSAPVDDGILVQDLTGDGADELLVLYADPAAPENSPAGDMIIYTIDGESFIESFRARAAGKVTILEIADINADEQPDIVYADTTCGASTCFDTINIRSWIGSEWADWTEEPITMAYAEADLSDASDEGQGVEIVLEGGAYGSAGAGPQRTRTEVWGSPDGAPYRLFEREFADSECIYFAVLDANAEFLKLPNADLGLLEQLYTKAATDPGLTTCWNRPDEEAELRSFALYRLALVAAYQGMPEISGDLIASISEIYTTSVYAQAGAVWLDAYAETESIPQACEAVNEFAAENPAAYEPLADYGYANPGFTANDVCPVIDVEAAAPTSEVAAPAATEPVEMTETVEPEEEAEEPVAEAAGGEMPACPDSLSDYAKTLPAVFAAMEARGDAEQWLRGCRALSEDRGAIAWGDFNSDGADDVIVLPVIISDLGFGPNGAQGAVLVYHGTDDGYVLEANPEIYGQSRLLAAEDVNDDDAVELGWTVVGCSTFCVTEVQLVTWNAEAEAYASAIEPGATLAEGEAAFEPLPPGAPGGGRMLVLTGGVSNTPEGGLSVPHREEWQSIGGAPFQRLSWVYDRSVNGNECMGLRLVEADVLLQASPLLGFDAAAAAYEAAFDPDLKACSIFGIDGIEELVYLQGLASFRLVQSQALGGDLEGATESVEALAQGQPDGAFTKAASEWLAAFSADSDPQAACDEIQSVFEENEQTWQITDHFGYNHPALAAEQICYVPPRGDA